MKCKGHFIPSDFRQLLTFICTTYISEMLKKSKEPKRGEAGFQQDPQEAYYENMSDRSPFNACAIDEGGSGCIKKMGGSWRVISNKTDKPWPAKYGSESKAKAALRGYHAG